MKEKKQHIRYKLGLTQEQLSLVLEIGHSQLALNETGLRQLPSSAALKLAEMVQIVNSAPSSSFMKSVAAEEAVKRQATLLQLLKENNYQQERLSRILIPLEQKYQSKVTAVYLVQQLLVDWKTKAPQQMEFLGALKGILTRALGKISYAKIVQLQIKLQVLQQEEKIVREQLGEV